MKSFEVGGRRGGGTNVWTTSIVSYKLVLSVFALGNYLWRTYLWNFTVGVLNISSEKNSKFQRDCSWIKSILTMFVVSWNFSVISKGSFIREYLNVKVTAHELFPCLLKAMWFISLSYTITTPKIFRINLSVLYPSQEITLLAHVSWNLWVTLRVL